MPQIVQTFFALVRGQNGALYGCALLLLALPALAFFAALVLALCLPRVRRSSNAWFLFFADFCECAFAALFLLGEAGRGALLEALCVGLFAKALYLALYGALWLPHAVCALRARVRERRKNALAARLAEEEPDGAAPPVPAPALPPKVRCFQEGGVRVERDVRLDHISQALRRLQNAPLTAGDRLETQAAQQLLSVYAGKGDLRSEEAESLNDVMASLLKMMARYDL